MMDNSGTSGSMQSSSGGDEDQESQHGYTTSMVSNNFGPRLSNPNNNYLVTSQQDYFSSHTAMNNFSSTSSFPGLDQVWSRSTLPSVPNSISSTLQNLVGHGSPSVIAPNSLFVSQANQTSFPSSSFPMMQQFDHHQVKSVALPEKPVATRKPKKRKRASRRSPTTVMVTDTANFRSMVQEFTGIPSPPFAGSPYSSSRRLDWLGGAARGRSTNNSLEQVGSLFNQPLKPTAYKPITTPFVSSSSSPNINVWDTSGLQNPNLSFQSLLLSHDIGTSVGYSSGAVPVVGPNKSQVNSMYNANSLIQDVRMLDQNIRQQTNPASSDLGGNDGREQLRGEENATNWTEGGNKHSVQGKEKFG